MRCSYHGVPTKDALVSHAYSTIFKHSAAILNSTLTGCSCCVPKLLKMQVCRLDFARIPARQTKKKLVFAKLGKNHQDLDSICLIKI